MCAARPKFEELNAKMSWSDIEKIFAEGEVLRLDVFAIERLCRVFGRRKTLLEVAAGELARRSTSPGHEVLELKEVNDWLDEDAALQSVGSDVKEWCASLQKVHKDAEESYRKLCERVDIGGLNVCWVQRTDMGGIEDCVLRVLEIHQVVRLRPEGGWEPEILLRVVGVGTGREG